MRLLQIIRVLLSAMLLSVFGKPALSQSPTDVRLALDWAFQGPVAMLLYGEQQGFFRDEGLNITIDRGFGSADAVQKVASGAYQFTLGDTNSMIEFNARNPGNEVVAVLMKYNKPTFSVVTMNDRGISSLKDLEGRKVASNEGLAARRVFPLLAAAAGVDIKKIEWVNVAPGLLDTIVIQKSADAGIGFWITQSLNMTAAQISPERVRSFLYTDNGVDLYGNAFLTTKRFAAANPDIVKRFDRAVVRCLKAAADNPPAMIAALKKREPATDETIELARLKLALEFIFTDEVKRIGLGAIDPARMQRAIGQLATVVELPNPPKVADVFDASFLPSADERRAVR